MAERLLVTGANGCIGAWVVAELTLAGAEVVALDVSDELHRLALVLGPEGAAAVPRVRGDIVDLDTLERTIDEHGITQVIHLAALQVPFCRADPALGARINVVGTVNVFEAVARRRDRMRHLVYASSIAAYDPDGRMDGHPSTIYGAFKRANEATAHVYELEHGLASIGLRPHTVFGPGRDRGVTSAPTAAMLAAAAGRRYHIPYGGRAQMQYTLDVAQAFIAAAGADATGASAHNLAGEVAGMDEIVAAIAAAAPEAGGLITHDHAPPAL